jgi:DNA polymerase-1
MRQLITANNVLDELQYLDKASRIAVDTETTGLDPFHDDVLVGISTCVDGRAAYFPFRHREGGNLSEEWLPKLLRVLERKNTTLYGYNFKFDLHFLAKEGFCVPQYTEDVQIAAHLMNENEQSFKLKILSTKYVDPDAAKEEAALNELLKHHYAGGSKAQISQTHAAEVAEYAAQDAWLTEALYNFYKPLLDTWNLYTLYEEICDYQSTLWRAEHRGIMIDKDKIRRYMNETVDEVEQLRRQLIQLSHGAIANPGSPKQICKWLGIESSRRDILKALASRSAIPGLILKFRALSKVSSTYYEPYLRFADANDVIHTTFRTTGTRTGRLSSAEPNLQQVARGSDIYRVKEVFIARPGYDLSQADYSQAEYRLVAHYSKQENMIQAFLDNVDFHERTGEQMGVDRAIGKTLNFATLYGLGAQSLAMKQQISEEEAAKYLSTYHEMYPRVRMFMKAAEARARTNAARNSGNGYVAMWTGRLRHFNVAVYNKKTGRTEAPFHKAGNSVIQGGVAEITRLAMIRLDKELPILDQLLQVHDAVIAETPEGLTEEILREQKRIMEDFDFRPPMRVDQEYGKNWGKFDPLKNPTGMRKFEG